MTTRLMRSVDWGTEVPDREITYTFTRDGGQTQSPFGKIVSAGFVGYEKAQFKAAFKLFASFTDLHFHEVKNPARADFRLATFRSESDVLGAMGPPGYGRSGGFGAFNYEGLGWDYRSPGTGGLEQGGFGFITIIHELGHGLGLAHPHDTGGSSTVFPGVEFSDDLGDYDLNQGVYTMMSYNDGWKTNPDGLPPSFEYGFEGTPMAIDIAVLQKKYGVNDDYHKGGNTYRLPDANEVGTFYSCIWDAGGRDAIVNRSASSSTIDLRAATLRPEPGGGGFISHADGIFGGFTIARKVKIENAEGGSGDDTIVGNAARNRLDGGDGDDLILGGARGDRLYGGAGDDVLVGGPGPDELNGGAGSAILTGGGGDDSFIFDVAPVLGGLATITDFAPGVDSLHMSSAAFAGIGPAGVLAAAALVIGAAAVGAADRVLYDPATGALRYDPDGSGDAAAIQFAALNPGLALSHLDIMVTA
jgi:serralysin